MRLGFQNGGEKLDSKSLVLDTELIRYKWQSQEGEYPDYEKVIPSEFQATATFDTKEALRVSQSLTAIWYDDSLKREYRPITLTIGDGKVIFEAKEDRGRHKRGSQDGDQCSVSRPSPESLWGYGGAEGKLAE